MTAISLNSAAFAAAPTAVRLPRLNVRVPRLRWAAIVTPLVTELPLVASLAVMTYAISRLF